MPIDAEGYTIHAVCDVCRIELAGIMEVPTIQAFGFTKAEAYRDLRAAGYRISKGDFVTCGSHKGCKPTDTAEQGE